MEQTVSTEELAYAAGFFDGEGYIGICGSVKGKSNSLSLEVVAVQVDPRPVQWLEQRFGGKVKIKVRSKYTSTRNGRPAYSWALYANDAMHFLKLIYPFLINKKDQADLAIRFQELVNHRKWKKVDKVYEKLEIKNNLKLLKKADFSKLAVA